MANQRDRDTNDLIRDSDEFAGGTGPDRGRTPEDSSIERGRSEENMRGTGDDSDEDDFEDTDELEDEEEDESEGTI
jgi:hypothetical protein